MDRFAWFWEKLAAYLADRNLKQTGPRREVIEFFLNARPHLSAEELHALMKRSGSQASLATIYRTLNLLKDAGLVEQRSFTEGHYVFEILDPEAHHDHLVCLDCNAVTEFHNQIIEQQQVAIAQQQGFELSSHHHVLFGHCLNKNCPQRKQSKKSKKKRGAKA